MSGTDKVSERNRQQTFQSGNGSILVSESGLDARQDFFVERTVELAFAQALQQVSHAASP